MLTKANSLKRPELYWVSVCLAVVFAIYYVGLDSRLIFDSQVAFELNNYFKPSSLSFDEWYLSSMSSVSGPLRRPVSMFTFALNAYFSDSGSWVFNAKLTNLLLHLFNAALVYYWLSLLVAGSSFFKRNDTNVFQYLPLIVTVLWVSAPMHQNAVLYLVQRMTLLSATFCLLALIFHAKYFFQKEKLQREELALLGFYLFICIGLSVFSKEVGVMTIPAIWLIHLCFYSDGKFISKNNKILSGFSILFVVALIILIWFSFAVGFRDYEIRSYNLVERIMTESRILLVYIKMLLLPQAADFSLFHDDFQISKGFFEPASTFISIIVIAIALLFSFVALKKFTVISFSIFWFFGMHSMESSVFPLELVFEHRNYLPSLSIFILLGFYGSVAISKGLGRVVAIFVVVLLSFSMFVTFLLASVWSDRLEFAKITYDNKPNSPRAAYMYAIQLMNIAEVAKEESVKNRAYADSYQVLTKALRKDENQQYIVFEGFDGLVANLIELKTLTNHDDVNIIYSRYLATLENRKLTPINREQILKLTKCVKEERCAISLDLLAEKLEKGDPVFYLQWMADRSLVIDKDYSSALAYVDLALEIESNSVRRNELINLKISLLASKGDNVNLISQLLELTKKEDFYFSLLSLKKRLVFK